jgi:predicted HicB family RNase H-like nuclease
MHKLLKRQRKTQMVFTKEEFAAKVKDIQSQDWYRNPIGFGIARLDRGQANPEKVLQATYPLVNWGENFGSAAVFLNALKEAGADIDTSKSELVCDISDDFLANCIETFRPYIPEARGNEHKNVQLISSLSTLPIEAGFGADDFKVVFLFEDANPELELNFQNAVNEYLETCDQLGREPQKAFKGVFNVRTGSDLHMLAVKNALKMGVSLNAYIKSLIEKDTNSNIVLQSG